MNIKNKSRIADQVISRASFFLAALVFVTTFCTVVTAEDKMTANDRIKQVANSKGLVAFWDFKHKNKNKNTWTSYYDKRVVDQGFSLYLNRIGDDKNYTPAQWPYKDKHSSLRFERTGPFGQALYINKGYLFGSVPRSEFDKTPLDLSGKAPFSMIAWVKFVGERHMVAGIWDEGGWNPYAGRRQAALFAGLFKQKGLLAHVSATGAASFPQSQKPGSQYARIRAIDGQAFDDEQWVSIAMTFDPATQNLTAYLNGVMTPKKLTDPVSQDVYRFTKVQPANPLPMLLPIYSPRQFVLKYNGYSLDTDSVSEHRIHVDTDKNTITYHRDETIESKRQYQVRYNLLRGGVSLLPRPQQFSALNGVKHRMPVSKQLALGDKVLTSLFVKEEGTWRQVGTEVARTLKAGAPFTFGRALGLGKEHISSGSILYIDGVAVFNRALSSQELKELSFVN